MILLLALSLFTQTLDEHWKQNLSVSSEIVRKDDLVIFENPLFGKVVAIHGKVELTQADEAVRHEMLVHVPLCAHKAPMSVLILGGANGGVLREVVKHTDVQRVVVVEPDEGLIKTYQTHFPSLSNGAFDDSRVQVIASDPAEFLQQGHEAFDVILANKQVDVAHVKSRLRKGGIFIHPVGLPFLEKNIVAQSREVLKAHFKHTAFYFVALPSSPPMAISFSSNKKYRPSDKALRERLATLQAPVTHYTPAVHRAAFALPASEIIK